MKARETKYGIKERILMKHERKKCLRVSGTRILAVICVMLLLVTSSGMTVLAEEWDNIESSEEELVGLSESNTWTVGDGVSASIYNEDGRNVLYFDSDGGTLSAGWKSVLGDVADDVNVIRFTDESTVMYLPRDSYNLFSLESVEEIDFEKVDTSNVEYMEYMFNDCHNLVSLNLTSFDTSKVVFMSYMFCGCESLQYIDVSSFDTSNVKAMYEMFMDCGGLTELNLSNFDISNVTLELDDNSGDDRGLRLIDGCTGLQIFKTPYTTRLWEGFNLPIPMYDEEGIQYRELHQALNHSITLVAPDDDEFKDLSQCEVSLEQTQFVYDGNAKMPHVVVMDGDTVLTEDADYTAYYDDCINAGTATVRVIGTGDYAGLQCISYKIEKADPVLAFCEAELTKKTDSEDFVNELYLCERDGGDSFGSSDESVAVVDPETGVVSIKGTGTAVITMYVTEGENYNPGSVSYTVTVQDDEAGAEYEWTVGDGVSASLYNEDERNVIYFNSDGGTLSADWKSILGDVINDVNAIRFTDDSTIMYLPSDSRKIFSLQNVEEIDLEKADTSKVEYMDKMFYDCRKLVSLDLTPFDTSSVVTMSYMFCGCVSLQHIDVSSFDTTNVGAMYGMFMDCGSLTELDLSNFCMSKVDYMFYEDHIDFDFGGENDDGSRIRLLEGCTGLRLFKTPYTGSRAGFALPIPMYDEAGTLFTGLYNSLSQSITLVPSDNDLIKDILQCEASLEQTRYMYTGKSIRPGVVVRYGDTVLKEDVDYKVQYNDCDAVGTANVRVIGIGEYSGTQRILFEIEKGNPILEYYSTIVLKRSDNGGFYHQMVRYLKDSKASYESSDESVAVVNSRSGYVSIKGLGTTVITVNVSEGSYYNAGTASYTLKVQDSGFEWSVGEGVTAELVYGENENILYFDSKGGELRKNWQVELDGYEDDVNKIAFTEDSTVMYLPEDSSNIFSDMENLVEMDTEKMNTERVSNMSEMFNECRKLKNLDLSGFCFSNVTNLSRMFLMCTNLEILNMSGADTARATDMSDMFHGCWVLADLDVSSFDTSNVTDMNEMFETCQELTSLDVSGFDTANVTDMNRMFSGCEKLTGLDVRGFETSNVTDMNFMFSGCSGLTSLDVSSFETSNVTDMSDMFSGCSGLTSLDVSGFDTSSVTDMGGMFLTCSGLMSLDVSAFDTSSVIYMGHMFCGCSGLTSLDVSALDTSNVIQMRYMFKDCSGLKSLNLGCIDTSNVTDMMDMFSGCSGLTSLDVSNLDTSSVKYMQDMFASCSSLKELDLSNFNTECVYLMQEMFAYCRSLENLNVSSFDTSNTSLVARMFRECNSLKELDLSNFNLSRLHDCDYEFYEQYEGYERVLFEGCSSLQVLRTPIGIRSGCMLPVTMYDESGTAYTEIPYKLESITLTSVSGPAISEQPTACKQVKGKRVKLSVAAEGEDLTYRWQSLKPGTSSWVNSGLASAKTATLSFTMSQGYDGMQYRCVVTDGFGRSVTSDAATVSLIAAPVITEQPASVESVIGVNVKLSVAAEGIGLTFRWQYLRPGTTTWNNSGLSSATTATLRFKMGDGYDGMKFRCVVTNSDDVSTTSDVATITAVRGPAIVMQPSDVDAASGTAVRISTQATGKNLTYRWQYKKMGSTTWVNSGLSSANTPVLSFKMSSGYDGRKYRCRVMDADENVVYTDTVLVTLVDGPAITKQPVDVTAAIGTRGVFSISATGEGLSYQWQYQMPGTTTWVNSGSSGKKTATLRVGATTGTNGMKFRCVVTDEEGIVAVSCGAVLTVI